MATKSKSRPRRRTPKKSKGQKPPRLERVPVYNPQSDLLSWALRTVAVGIAALRVMGAKLSFVFFSRYYFGIRLAIHQEIWIRLVLLCPRALILAPRGHGKTEVMTKLLPMWLIVRNADVRILIVAISKQGNADKHVELIKAELETNEKLIRDFGPFKPTREDAWRHDFLRVIRPTKRKDPTVQSAGMDSSVTGARFDYIFCDDIIDDKSVNTPELIKKTERYLTATFIPLLESWGKCWMIGTRKQAQDIYDWAIKNTVWKVWTYRAIIREPKGYEVVEREKPRIRRAANGELMEEWFDVVFKDDDRGEVLWPERHPIESLILLRKELGTVIFNREYQNEVIDDETALFKRAHLEQCRDEAMSYTAGILPEEIHKRYRYIVQGVDPSLVTSKREAERRDSDYFAQVALGLTHKGRLDVLAIDYERGMTPVQVENRIIAFYNRIRPARCAVEANSFGVIHTHNLIEGTDLALLQHWTGQNKHDPYEGVPHLSALYECGKVRLPYMTEADKKLTDEVISQFHAFGSTLHDDIVMAFWIAQHAIQKWVRRQILESAEDEREDLERDE